MALNRILLWLHLTLLALACSIWAVHDLSHPGPTSAIAQTLEWRGAQAFCGGLSCLAGLIMMSRMQAGKESVALAITTVCSCLLLLF